MNKKLLLFFCAFLVSCTSTQFSSSSSPTFTPSPPTFTPSPPTLTFTPALPTKTNTPVFTSTPTPLPTEITDVKNIKMGLVPEGTFMIGNNPDIYEAFLKSYYMDIYEVTNAAYKLCVDNGTCQIPSSTITYNDSTYAQHPVIYVDWNMARTYCEWRDARLPTEAEWEKAARGTNKGKFPWGDKRDCAKSNFFGCKSDTTPVGSYESGKSPYGMYDMYGNVWEWVSSLFLPYPYDANDGRENLSAPGFRVLRGGAWINQDASVSSPFRYRYSPLYSSFNLGFRCARSP